MFQQLDGVYADVKAMNDCCLDMCDKLAVSVCPVGRDDVISLSVFGCVARRLW